MGADHVTVSSMAARMPATRPHAPSRRFLRASRGSLGAYRSRPVNTALSQAEQVATLSASLHVRTTLRWPTKPRTGMSYPLSSPKQVRSPKYLSLPWFITLVAAFCVLVPVAGTVAQEVGGWL